MNTAEIIGCNRRVRKIKAIHLQKANGANYKNICGNGNSWAAKAQVGPPNPDSIFFNAVLNNINRACPTCLKLAVKQGLIRVSINF